MSFTVTKYTYAAVRNENLCKSDGKCALVKAFVAAVEELALVATEMKLANDNNKILIDDALDYLEFNMNIVHSSLDTGPVGYGETLDDGREPGSFIDTKS